MNAVVACILSRCVIIWHKVDVHIKCGVHYTISVSNPSM
jgi:hypothetical protein